LRPRLTAPFYLLPLHPKSARLLFKLVSDQVSSTDDFSNLEDTVGLETLEIRARRQLI
jgi:hypothetical protein